MIGIEALHEQVLCDRGCDRPALSIVTLPHGSTRMVCDRCMQPARCANCDEEMERWKLTVQDGEPFCERCGHVAPGAEW